MHNFITFNDLHSIEFIEKIYASGIYIWDYLGLLCFTFSFLNNNPRSVKVQLQLLLIQAQSVWTPQLPVGVGRGEQRGAEGAELDDLFNERD